LRIIATTTVDVNQEKLFYLSQDYSVRLEWDTYLKSAKLVDSDEAGLGKKSLCKSKFRFEILSEYITFNPPRLVAIEMVSGPIFLRKFSASWQFKMLTDKCTEVIFTYSFNTNPRFLSWLIEPIIAKLYRIDMQIRIEAFKNYSEKKLN